MNRIRRTIPIGPRASRSPALSLSAGALAMLLAASACGGTDANATPGDASAAPATEYEGAASPADPQSGTSSDQLQLRISQGPFAGAHEVMGDFDCFAQPGIWGAGLTRMGDEGISQVNLMLQGLPVTGGTSEQVDFTVVFGDMMDETSDNAGIIGLGAVAGGGSGTGTGRREGRGAVIEVEGTTHDGTEVSAVVRCDTVEVVQ